MIITKKLKNGIVSEKYYTLAEKEAFKELLQKTNGLTTLPTSKDPRDVIRFNKFARDFALYSVGKKDKFDKENAKELLKSVGLDKYSNIVDKMVDKYSNKKALIRLAKLKDAGKIPFGNPENVKNICSDLMNSSAKYANQAYDEIDNKNINGDFPKSQNLFNSLKKEAENNGYIVTTRDDSNSSYVSYADRNINMLPKEGDNFATLAHELGHAKTKQDNVAGYDLLDTLGRFRKIGVGKKNDGDWHKFPVNCYRVVNDTNPITNKFNGYKGILDSKNMTLQMMAKHLLQLANENSASTHGLAVLKKLGASPEQIKEAEKDMNLHFGTYLHSGVNQSAFFKKNEY